MSMSRRFMSSMVSLDDFKDLRSLRKLSAMDKLLKVAQLESQKLENELHSKTDVQEKLGLKKETNSKDKFVALFEEEEEDDDDDDDDEGIIEEESSSKNQKKEFKNSKNQKKQKKKFKNPKNQMAAGPNPPPDLPEKFKNRINELGGAEITLLIQKSLYKTDVNKGNNRLSMPLSQIKADFLREREKEMKEITIPLIQPSLEIIDIVLVKWDMPKDSGVVSVVYNLKTSWMKVAKANKLKANNVIQVWSFRVQEQLFMALVKVL